MKDRKENKILLVPTGFVIKDYLDEYGVTQADFIRGIGVSKKYGSDLLSGKTELTEDMAQRIEMVIKNVPAAYWLNYESLYQKQVKEGKEKTDLKR